MRNDCLWRESRGESNFLNIKALSLIALEFNDLFKLSLLEKEEKDELFSMYGIFKIFYDFHSIYNLGGKGLQIGQFKQFIYLFCFYSENIEEKFLVLVISIAFNIPTNQI